jgi:hypothetical protein
LGSHRTEALLTPDAPLYSRRAVFSAQSPPPRARAIPKKEFSGALDCATPPARAARAIEPRKQARIFRAVRAFTLLNYKNRHFCIFS